MLDFFSLKKQLFSGNTDFSRMSSSDFRSILRDTEKSSMLKNEPIIRSPHMRDEHHRNAEMNTFQNRRVPYKSIYGRKTAKTYLRKSP